MSEFEKKLAEIPAYKGLAKREYSQGACQEKLTIFCDGRVVTIKEILDRLHALEHVRAVICDSPEINPSNYDHDQVCQLNTAMSEAWSLIESVQ